MTEKVISNWKVDHNHSEVQFKVKHLAISNVSGTFKIFNGSVEAENPDFSNAKIKFEIDTNSIHTNNLERDGFLQSPNFLNIEKFPKISFIGILKKFNGDFKLEGELTILATTKRIVMNAEQTGEGVGRFDDIRAGLEVNGKINRKDFGLELGLLTETGNLVVGEEIKLHFDIQIIKQ